MKSWGVRIGMATATGLLGLLAIAQAQRDRLGLSAPEVAEMPSIVEPLKPIPSFDGFNSSSQMQGTSFAPPSVFRGNDQAVQQVGLNEAGGPPASLSENRSPPPMAIPSMPSIGPSLELSPATTAPPSFAAASPNGTTEPAANGPSLSLSAPSVNVPASPSVAAPNLSALNLVAPSLSGAAPALQTAPLSAPTANLSLPGANNSYAAADVIGSGVAMPSNPGTESVRISPMQPTNALRDIDAPGDQPSYGNPTANPPSLAPSISANTRSQSNSAAPTFSGNSQGNLRNLASQDYGRNVASDLNSGYGYDKNAMSNAPSHTESKPGDVALDGAQTPSVMVHKKAPAEVKVGQAAMFVIHVRNTGPVTAHQVRVDDQVPKGMRMQDATPTPQIRGDLLTWVIGDLEPGGERSINLRLIPEVEGELGSVARVSFEAAASVRTIATRPELRIKQLVPPQVLVGQQLEIEIEISNPGTGSATDVVLEEDVPVGLEHPKGSKMEYPIGVLQPGESRRLPLRMIASEAGSVRNVVRASSAEVQTVEDSVAIEITAPKLVIDLQGPSRRFLERQATFEMTIANRGTAPAGNVEIVAYLDRGLTFVSTEFRGVYDSNRHAVIWSLAELPPGVDGKVPLKLMPVEEGNRVVRMEARGDLGKKVEYTKTIAVEALAELTFSVADQHDPIEVGSDTTYEIRVTNHGSRGDSNVRLQVDIPAGLNVLSCDPPTQANAGRGLAFPPLARMDAKGEYAYRVTVRGIAPGEHVIRAMLTSDSSQVPVTKEEKTTVYADQ